MKNLGLYFHIPFCNSKCLYCDFDSGISDYLHKKRYANALMKEIDMAITKYSLNDYKIDTVFIGGGTPTSLDEDLLQKVLQKIDKSFNFSDNLEYTIEMNPNSVTDEKIEIIRESKINRVSIGLQSTNMIELKALGRTHTYEEFLSTYKKLRNKGFTNISIDLMMGIPNQDFKTYEENLRNIISLMPEHISAYMLIIEEDTPFFDMYEKGIISVDDELTLKLYEYTINKLQQYGYNQYEFSNFAKKGYECKHNIKYWKVEEYLGFGQNAHSLFGEKRFENYSDEYINSIEKGELPINNVQEHTKKDMYEEWIFLKLRMNEGIDISELDKQFDINFKEKYAGSLEKLYKENLIQEYDKYLRLTTKGIEVSNKVFLEFI